MSSRAIIHITIPTATRINYSRRMYAIIRRYTPAAVEGSKNECYAELTGLRTFFKMNYQEITEKILSDLFTEIGIICKVTVAKSSLFDSLTANERTSRKSPLTVSTYKEINKLFVGKSFVEVSKRIVSRPTKRVRLTVPFIGRVS